METYYDKCRLYSERFIYIEDNIDSLHKLVRLKGNKLSYMFSTKLERTSFYRHDIFEIRTYK